MNDKVKQGKRNRANGAAFELRVRKDLTEKGWIVDKWGNNVEFSKEIDEIKSHKMANHYLQCQVDYLTDVVKGAFRGKLIQSKNKWNNFTKTMMMGTGGFPDFIAFKKAFKPIGEQTDKVYEVIGVESKVNGYLDKEERAKCKWLLNNNVFSKILIASKYKIKNRVSIEYKEFKDAKS